jgi:hypothetical protein
MTITVLLINKKIKIFFLSYFQGQYMCQINTARAKTRLGNLHVVGLYGFIYIIYIAIKTNKDIYKNLTLSESMEQLKWTLAYICWFSNILIHKQRETQKDQLLSKKLRRRLKWAAQGKHILKGMFNKCEIVTKERVR